MAALVGGGGEQRGERGGELAAVLGVEVVARLPDAVDLLVQGGWMSQEAADDVPDNLQTIVEAMHAMLTDTPSLLLQAALVDGVGECRSQNQPGTSREYSNWRVPLADSSGHVVHTDEVFDLPRVQSLAAVMRREKR